jgi:RNA polymerase sigma factor (sigma-70 family)
MARRHLDLSAASSTGPTDADLTLRAAQGERDAFDELYRRHADAAWRVAYAVTGNPHDAADAVSEAFTRVFAALPEGRFPAEAPFRPYLLTSTRNAAIDGIRRTGKLQPSEQADLEVETAGVTPGDAVVGALDSSLVASAFLSLPERWRSVLWLTEVEGLQPREIADMLGISANGAAQLAVRARNGLRDHFLQAHLRGAVAKDCKFTVEHLGAYVGGTLSARDVAKVDQHLAGCDACRARQSELEDISSTLRRVALPLPIGLAGIAAARWKLAAVAAARAGRHVVRAGAATTRAVRPLAIAASITLAFGIIGVALVNPNNDTELGTGPRSAAQEVPRPATVIQGLPVLPAQAVANVETIDDVALQQAALATTPRPSTAPPPASPPSSPPSNNPPPAPAPAPLLQASVRTTPADSGVAAGDQCTGAELGGAVVIGCPPPAPAPTAVLATVEVHSQILGDHTIAI